MTVQQKAKKQFGVWLDGQQATVVGRTGNENSAWVILGHVKHAAEANNSNENAANNHEMAAVQKYFKTIAAMMPNVHEVHVTGTGQMQERFIHFLADTAQYRNTVATDSTSIKMGDEQLLTFIANHFK